ncbi:hypothetical protein ACVXZ0_09230 [Staphylococcus aureus]
MSDYNGMNKIDMMNQIKVDTMLHGHHAAFLLHDLLQLLVSFVHLCYKGRKKKLIINRKLLAI